MDDRQFTVTPAKEDWNIFRQSRFLKVNEARK